MTLATYDAKTHHWSTRGLCRHQPELWTELDQTGRYHTTSPATLAAHLCGHCPVLETCARDAMRTQPMSVVQAGIVYSFHGKRIVPPPLRCGPECRQVTS